MITVKTPQEIKILEEGGKILASILGEAANKVKAGISTKELDVLAEKLIKKAGAKPALLGYKPWGHKTGYPAVTCVSVNDEVVHGLPSEKKILREGDIVSVDLTIEYGGLFTDSALTVGVGRISDKAQKLINVTKKSLSLGVAELKNGTCLGDYGFAVQSFVEGAGFSIVRDLVGHGVGYAVHEEPNVPNWGRKKEGLKLKEGMVLALEPMVCEGSYGVKLDKDGWTWRTKDGLLSAHFEHTVVVKKGGCQVLTKI